MGYAALLSNDGKQVQNLFVPTFVSIGDTSPARTGNVRLEYGGSITARNQGDTGDIEVISYANNKVTIGGGATGIAIAFPDGTAAAPGIAFAAQPTTGFFRGGSGRIALATGNALALQDGSAASPALAFTSDATTGLARIAAGSVSVVAGGNEGQRISGSGTQITNGDLLLGTSTKLRLDGNYAGTTYIVLNGANNIALIANSATQLNVSSTAITASVPVVAPVGAVGAPAYTFTGYLDSGLYWISADRFGMAVGGGLYAYVDGTAGLVVQSGVNFGLNGITSAGGGVGVVTFGNATTVPNTNPTGGGVLYAQAGALKWRGSSGTVTTIANA